jgi:hypothetical protein
MKSLAPILLCIPAITSLAKGAITYGPSPYFGASDSPFNAGIQAGTIYLEDFEDHALNTPNVAAVGTPTHPWNSVTWKTLNPGAAARSVDADDGLLGDFMGFAGDSFVSRFVGSGLISSFHFQFSADAQGRYPTFFGIVITRPADIFEDIEIGIWAPTDPNVRLFPDAEFPPADWFNNPNSFPGDTRIHRFIGFYHEAGFGGAFIAGAAEVDHLQYGYAIPEPGAFLLACLGVGLAFRRRR